MSSDIRREIDEAVIEETDDVSEEMAELVGHFTNDQVSGEGELGLYEDWMPGSDEHKGKTRITSQQAHSLAAMINLPKVYGLLGMHVEGFDEFIESLAQDYMQLLPSVIDNDEMEDARTQQMKVLMAKAGVHAEAEEMQKAAWRRVLSGTDDDDD